MHLEAGLIPQKFSMKPEAKERIEALLKKMAEEEARYRKEKKEVETEAKRQEKDRDLNRSKDPYFEFAKVLLQIAIVLASISLLATSRTVFYFASVIALLGTLLP